MVASKATFGYAFPAGPAAHFAARTGTLEERRRVVAARRVSGAIARGLGGRENVVAGAAGVGEGGGGGRREGGGVCVVEANNRAHHGLEGVSGGSNVFEKVSDEVSNAKPRGRSKKVVIRPASAFRGDEGRFVGDKSRTDIEGDGGAAAFVFGGG